MKKLSKLKLTQLNKVELENREMKFLKGGAGEKCGCMCSCVGDICACYIVVPPYYIFDTPSGYLSDAAMEHNSYNTNVDSLFDGNKSKTFK